jgi:hypothetical protein
VQRPACNGRARSTAVLLALSRTIGIQLINKLDRVKVWRVEHVATALIRAAQHDGRARRSRRLCRLRPGGAACCAAFSVRHVAHVCCCHGSDAATEKIYAALEGPEHVEHSLSAAHVSCAQAHGVLAAGYAEHEAQDVFGSTVSITETLFVRLSVCLGVLRRASHASAWSGARSDAVCRASGPPSGARPPCSMHADSCENVQNTVIL